ncbi:hypothetical protein A3742_05775 [Oleiphilus sp. HI0071]|uniref:DUF1853 family protein n=1 Tax=Oleiphilus sp. HI0080 TaxID=1822255 RepID=UPI0007C3D7A8|nr:DUF1853 family protein [Oleiphilus sp. HI0080]KZY60110.1 hypothetical protein A3737_06735 [Oleiphilus sp. HI0065]KZY84316.1 hypothetical protein A3742_05775 [Oleiphilus sp. HI0071]KZZ02417.1 hypothetical protein A3744_11285 [Oleiphilus sp. HI0073]KZZ50294.1 hypothetical protein A3760_02020 [Oleiphilus sp. HI0122]KZY63531.1 hypothetical protein A3737_18510 [Oleiphilus sp. HI0065]
MVSKLQYKSAEHSFKQALALRNLSWFLSQADLIKAESLGSHTHIISDEIDLDSASYSDQLSDRLEQSPSHFLGSYVEQLWRHYIETSSRYQLLAHNLQIHGDGKTLGEFDFIVGDNITGKIIHQEIAAKFYLGLPAPDHKSCLWFGPNNIDRLDLKAAHLKNKQLRLSDLEHAKAELERRHITKVTTQCILRGRLFLPWNQQLRKQCQDLDKLTQHSQKDVWMTLSELRDYAATKPENAQFWLLEKQQWLSLMTRKGSSLRYDEILAKLEQVVGNERRGVMLKTQRKLGTGLLNDETALFIVPDDWQKYRYDSLTIPSEKPLHP